MGERRDVTVQRTQYPAKKQSLTRSQTMLLLLLQKFRFLTTDLAAVVALKDRSTLYERFALLVSRGYAVKRYDSSYRLAQKAARYSLSVAGIAYLRKHTKLPESSLRRHYGNQAAEEGLVDAHIQAVERYLLLQQALPHHNLFTNYELTKDEAIRPFPHVYAQPKSQDGTCYFLDYFPPFTASWLLRRRLSQHQTAEEDDDVYIYPHVLLVAGNQSTERRLFSMSEPMIQDFRLYITCDELLHDPSCTRPWIDVNESDSDEYLRISLS